MYETERPLFAFSAGWYYGGVPIKRQNEIDRAILELRLQDKIRQLISREIDSKMPANCSAMSADIPPEILGWLLLSAVSICMVPVLASLIFAANIKQRDRLQKEAQELRDEAQ